MKKRRLSRVVWDVSEHYTCPRCKRRVASTKFLAHADLTIEQVMAAHNKHRDLFLEWLHRPIGVALTSAKKGEYFEMLLLL